MHSFWARYKFFMNPLIRQTILLAGLLTGIFGVSARAQNLDQIGVTLLRTQTTNLDGSGIRVAQPEASAPAFEVNPASVGQPTNRFTYASAAGTATNYPNSVGSESGHADGVGANFYGMTGSGVATNVARVDNFDANYFVNTYVVSNLMVLNDSVVNQSFIFTETNGGHASVGEQQEIDSAYDDYAAQYGTLFISGAGNSGSVSPAATSYNGIGVAAYGGSSSIGPTLDNGRCKPDLTAPASATSFSTPQVSGAAAVLMQAALRGDGGSDTNAAFDLRTIKALLLNGAVKPANWTNSNSSPLDARYGAGVLNVFNSYKQLAGGKNNPSATDLILTGAVHTPFAVTNVVAANSGWNLQSISSTATNDAVNHYFFNATNGFVAATLVWNRQHGETNINDLDLFLYDCASSNLVACSTSRVDNVEHIFVPSITTGTYDLQVLKNGGTNVVSDSETCALAFAFAPTQLSLARTGTNAVLTWPVYPAGFCVEATTNLAAPTWRTNSLSATLTGNTNILSVTMTNEAQFFRLRQPNF